MNMNLLLIPEFVLLFAFLAYKRWSPLLLGPTVLPCHGNACTSDDDGALHGFCGRLY